MTFVAVVRAALFFLFVLGALVGINTFVYRRARAAFDLSRRARQILIAVLATTLLAVILGRTIGRWTGDELARAVGGAGMIVQLGVIVAFAMLGVERLGVLLWRAASKLRFKQDEKAPVVDDPPQEEGLIGRRELLSRTVAGTALGVGASSALYGAIWGRHDYVIEEVPVRLAKLPRTLDGFTLVQLSDIHLGTFVGEREIGYSADLVAQAKPDLIVLTGDHVDHDERYMEMLGAMLRRLRDIAPIAAVPGNHDYYAGIHAMTDVMQRAGVELLVNRSVKLGDRGGRIALCGVDDVWARRQYGGRGPDLKRALTDVPDDVARILLCHNPEFFPEAAERVDLQLSGHTHGGQFNPLVRPAELFLPYIAGRYQRGDAQLYVNRGFGTAGPPARLGAAPEVTKIILTT
ncbi:MAG TPA: metallophosphoesterase [Polyangiaceae bacterium]|nr:metallophosphoesterase [Polyangiaceae bacterium]